MADDISALVRASLEAKIIEAFRSTPEMIDELVRACCAQEVNSYGGKPEYHDREKMPYLTYLARKTIQGVAHKAVIDWVTSIEPQIRDAVLSRLATDGVVDAFCKAIIGTTDQPWKVDISFAKAE